MCALGRSRSGSCRAVTQPMRSTCSRCLIFSEFALCTRLLPYPCPYLTFSRAVSTLRREKVAKFGRVRVLTLLIDSNYGEDTTRSCPACGRIAPSFDHQTSWLSHGLMPLGPQSLVARSPLQDHIPQLQGRLHRNQHRQAQSRLVRFLFLAHFGRVP